MWAFADVSPPAAEFSLHRERLERRPWRAAARVATTVGLLVLLGYCVSVAWNVLEQLAAVRLLDVSDALRVVSVRDALLCLVGYKIAKELLRALLAARPFPR
ncbi:MAG: hypothetical protein KIT14_14535 [bacterium]|nr:hypothetical protein [bacterium]